MPDATATGSAVPIALKIRPAVIRVWTNQAMAPGTRATSNSCGTPALRPTIQPKAWRRISASMCSARWPEANWATDRAMPPTASVEMKDGTSATTLILADILQQAGLPAGVYNVVTGAGRVIGQALAEHPDVDMLSFTGSTAVGRTCVQASAASNLKKLGLELGGKNPIVVFADSNLDDAAGGAAFGISFNTGQCCVSSSRLIVERSVAPEFERILARKMAQIRVGDPLDPRTQVGAITTAAQNDTILGYIEKGKQEGAKIVYGGGPLDLGRGQFIQPTLFSGVAPSMSIARDEIFGPVLSSFHFDTIEEAITLANDTVYGLAASVWTSNLNKALTVTRRVRAGRFWVNTIMAGGPETPAGGFKQSGWGRETGVLGVEEYTQVKAVHVDIGPRAHWIES
ncbi:aldehyde dehydrogenase family protein [Gluconacetobacter diazotrophicus]|uniref:Aldehyde dehydrogenase family protein n=2 Tax=Gluconacetobacter diazotrophicus TaxID=33996 RepID=A0A7W4I8Z7_GLUDI|nr:aldehyde dehydrogenase family protein [Gluconacetobacter diazotrophicus]